MKSSTIIAGIAAAVKSVLTGGSPFAMSTILYPPNEDGKYVISSESVRLAFTLHAAALTNLWINDTNGVERDIVMGLNSVDDYSNYSANPFLNGIIAFQLTILLTGRYAGLIDGAEFDIDGITYNTSPNGNGGSATLNGGQKGWGRRKLDVASHSHNSITFVIFDRGWNGFPGNPASCITHTIIGSEWHIAIGLTPVRLPTPVSLSQQVFWNLDGFASASNHTVAHHKLWLPFSGFRFAVDKRGVSTGDIMSNAKGSSFDFWSEEKLLDEALRVEDPGTDSHLDENFMLARSQPWTKDEHPVATLSSELSGIKVELYTDQEALHVHSWSSHADTVPLKGQDGQIAPELAAISIEMQNWPDAINHPEWQREKKLYGALKDCTRHFLLSNSRWDHLKGLAESE